MILKVDAGAETMLLHSPTQFTEWEGGGYGSASLIQADVRLTALVHVGKGKHLGGSAQPN